MTSQPASGAPGFASYLSGLDAALGMLEAAARFSAPLTLSQAEQLNVRAVRAGTAAGALRDCHKRNHRVAVSLELHRRHCTDQAPVTGCKQPECQVAAQFMEGR